MSLTQSPPTAGRVAAWLLILSPVVFVAWIATNVAVLGSRGIDDAPDITPAQMADIPWAVISPVYGLAVLAGSAGIMALRGRHRLDLAARVAAGLAAVAILGHVVLTESMAGFTEARLGDAGAWQPATVLSVAAIWLSLVAVVLTGLALRASGSRTGTVVAALAAVVLVADAVLGGAFPPLVVSVFWLVLGIAALRRPVRSGT